jgi:ABC-2 type transport system permease protein
LTKLSDFLYNGGQYGKLLMYTADASHAVLPNMNTFLKEWGIAVDDGAVFETKSNRTYQNQPFYPVADYKDTTFQNMLVDTSAPMLLPVSHPLQQLYEYKDNYTNTVLLEFASTSAVMPSDAGSDFTPDKATIHGPLPAMILCTKNIYDNNSSTVKCKSEVLVSSSTEMLDTYSMQNTSLADSQYLLNVFNTEFEQKASINIQPKSLAGLTLTATTEQVNTIGILLFAVIPIAILVSGIAIWLVRRYK